MKDKVDISVIMCVYNGEKYISESIQSILNQTFTAFEIIVIDDGSTDKTSNIIHSFTDERIKYYYQKNQGASISRNNAINKSVGKFIAVLDSDDISLPERLELEYAFLKKSKEFVLCGSAAYYIDQYGSDICKMDVVKDWQVISNMKYENPFIHSSVLYKREEALKAGLYPKEVVIGEDLLFYNKLKEFGKLTNLDVPLVKYRFYPEAASNRSGSTKDILKIVIDEYLEKGEIKPENLKALRDKKNELSKNEKHHYYHTYLAKLFLFQNNKPLKALRHLLIAFCYHPFSLKWLHLFLISFFPFKSRKKVYLKFKQFLK